jgi:hypothetical protein
MAFRTSTSLYIAFSFKVPQCHEACLQVLLGVYYCLDGAVLPRLFEKLLFVAPMGLAGQEQVGVRVNQAGRHRSPAEVDDLRPGGRLQTISRADSGDPTAMDQNHLVV